MRHSPRPRQWTEELPMPSLRTSANGTTVAQTLSHCSSPANTVNAILPPPVLQSNGSGLARQTQSVFRVFWAGFVKRIGTTAVSSSSAHGDKSAESTASPEIKHEPGIAIEEVDEIVVDRVWSEEMNSSTCHSELEASPEKSGESRQYAPSIDRESVMARDGLWSSVALLVVVRWRVWSAILKFFSSRFLDEKYEQQYAQENWFVRKPLALWSSLFLIINWILGCVFNPRPWVLPDKIFLGAVAPVFSIPVLFMVMYDFPRDRPIFYQVFLGISTWCWAMYQVSFMFICGFYGSRALVPCGARDFLGLFYYASGLQTISLFGLKLNRFTATLGALSFFLVSCSLIAPIHVPWTRVMISFVVYQTFLLYVHYVRENSERRLYNLRDQLKMQYKATQKAQINERKASDSKRRLTSYVFHEVRVPLNTALLAVQNMEASGIVDKTQEIEFKALEGSLNMMSKVLNDVLDFNRMDSGRFESVSKPYAFHQTMRSLFIPLRLATDARRLDFVTSLDPNIDWIARYAAYEAAGESLESIRECLETHPDGDGVVVGDETRLRQIITNLASNACKFTPAGGKLMISTRLVMPSIPFDIYPPSGISISQEPNETRVSPHGDGVCPRPLSTDYLKEHNLSHEKPASPLERIVVRIEVTDTGYGIRPKDIVESKLFSAFNQTEQGREQGGKGTGLGLALVRQIVKLTGGRLGVRSQVGKGSTFWVELPLGVGAKTFASQWPPSLGAGGLLTSDLEVLQAAGNDTHVAEYMRNAGTMGLEAAAPNVSPKQRPASTQSSSALHSLMEQGGRVELVLHSHKSASLDPDIRDLPTCKVHIPPYSSPSSEELSPESLDHPSLHERPSFLSPKRSSSGCPSLPETRTHSFEVNSFPPDHSHMRRSSFLSASSRSLASNPPTVFESGLEVLVVDDDPLTRTLMKRMLARLGCNVATAENGELALNMILGTDQMSALNDTSGGTSPILEQLSSIGSENRFAVVFLDNQMPVMSGLKVVEKLRDLGRHDFVVGVTGNALLTDQKEYLDAGADHVLTKPVLERNLRGMLAVADERRRRTPLGKELS